ACREAARGVVVLASGMSAPFEGKKEGRSDGSGARRVLGGMQGAGSSRKSRERDFRFDGEVRRVWLQQVYCWNCANLRRYFRAADNRSRVVRTLPALSHPCIGRRWKAQTAPRR